MSTASQARSRRDLSLDEIIGHATDIMADEGEHAVTMRRVANECGVTAMAIYNHVDNKEELLVMVVDRVIGDVLRRAPQMDDWRASLVEFASTLRAALLANPGAGTVFLRRPILSENLTRTTEYLFACLERGGIRGRDAAEATDAIVLTTMGSIANDLTRPAAVRQELMRQVPVEETPHLAELIDVYAERDGDQRLRLALTWLLDGAARDAARSRGARTPPRRS